MAYNINFFDTEESSYKLKDGFILKDELNETLDSGLITFFSEYSLDGIESFDLLTLSEDNNTHLTESKLSLVDSYEEDITCFGSNFSNGEYKYTMTLFSETKELERIVLPNCSVTQPINGNTPHTVYEEIERFVELYGLKVKIGTTSSFSYENKYIIDDRISAKFSNVVCPEFQWNRPTLREVLNDLMSTKDCIVILKNNHIDYIDLTLKGNQIDTTKLLYSKRSINSQDYVGELSIDMQNAIGKNKTTMVEYISLRAPDGETTMTTENCIIRTQHPIYAIKKITVYVNLKYRSASSENDSDTWRYANITDNVIEDEEWNLLSSVKIGGTAYGELENIIDSEGRGWKAHKVNFLHFKRGENEIKNIGNLYSSIVGLSTNCYTAYIINKIGNVTETGYFYDSDPRNMIVEVEYETVMEHSMNVGKYLPNHHPNNRIVDNQTNSYVDIQHQSIFEYAKANRLGNKIREVGGNYSNDNEVPKLGERIGDEVLFSRELCYWDNMVQFKGFLAPNYILKDFFTGVAAKKRAWQIASEKDALTRHDVYKVYIEASFSRKDDNWDDSEIMPIQFINETNNTGNVIDYLVSIASYTSFGGVKYALCDTVDKNGVKYPDKNSYQTTTSTGVILDTDIEIQGMSLCFNFGYNDNLKSADYIIKEDNEYTQSFYPYADGNGEFVKHRVELLGRLYGLGNKSEFTPIHTYEPSKSNEITAQAFRKPRVTWEGAEYQNSGLYFELNTQKDNREIIQHTIQFEYCSDSKDIIIGKKLIELSKLYASQNHTLGNLRLHYSTENGDRYELGEEKDERRYVELKTTNVEIQSLNSYVLSVYCKVIVLIGTLSCWSITDLNNNILVAVNGNRTIYFNLLRDRDTNIYSSDRKTIVGKLGD